MTSRPGTPPANDRLEQDLRDLFDVQAPAWVEGQVRARVLATTMPDAAPIRRRPWATYLLAADRLDLFGRGRSVEVVQGTPLHVASEAGGWNLTLEHAYADSNKLDLFVFAEPIDPTEPLLFVLPKKVSITDEEGDRTVLPGDADDGPQDGVAALEFEVLRDGPIAGSGPRQYALRIDALVAGWGTPDDYHRERIAGPWELEFSVGSTAGVELEPMSRDERDGVAITLERLSVSPSTVQAHLTVVGAPPGIDWSPVLSVEKGPYFMETPFYQSVDVRDDESRVYEVVVPTTRFDDGPDPDGLTDPFGRWQIRVLDLSVWDNELDRQAHLLPGPWDLSFEAVKD